MPHCKSASFIRKWATWSTTAVLLMASMNAWSQAHESHGDAYTLRSTTVPSTAISASAARQHGIDPAANRAILNVMVHKKGDAAGGNVEAEVQATARNLAGQERAVAMRPAKAPNGQVSYIGTYEFASREVLDFRIRARPAGMQQPLELAYRERMPAAVD